MTSVTSGRLPQRRQDGMVCEDLPDGGAIVVDLTSSVAHGLDPLAATVLKYADGTHSVTAVAAAASVSEEVIEATLRQLSELGLLEKSGPAGQSRRRLLARAAQVGGGLVVAGGVINSLALPAAAAALSQTQRYVLIDYDAGSYYIGDNEDGSSQTATSSMYYLTPTELVTTSPGASTPYVLIDLVGARAVDLTFVPGSSATTEASYGPGPGGQAPNPANSLTANQQQATSVPDTEVLYVAIGT